METEQSDPERHSGDTGMTNLSDGSRVDKDTPRLEAIGAVEELSSHIGFTCSVLPKSTRMTKVAEILIQIRHDLMELGDALNHPGAALLSQAQVRNLDVIIDDTTVHLFPPRDSGLSVGSTAVSAFHVARSVARRAERRLLSALAVEHQPSEFGTAYLNRLSDLLTVLARTVASEDGNDFSPV